MATIDYPATLPSPLATKTRSQPARYSMLDPRRGPSYSQKTGTDVSTQWSLTFRFTEHHAQIFWLWYETVIDGGVAKFNLPLRTEFGIVTHECQFVPDSLLPASNDARVWTYTATITARKLVIPQSYLDLSDIIIGFPNWQEWQEPLDFLINQYNPES